ncbi:hypothetical protein CYLTODRAFT_452463 [Cylindrobasidium torrendii FP15055 ss-10]|uniref:Uncharacterized protein n=1 Tax=Cylindrobasidium torrendii FP15055 ss-10 TaxID=1314674 RepID=A0A0D7BGJ1_9AGAR|nr:hypothetical protein CYLTODRAFT_452463 [Cylindrobasidium torrendii FP15055 ss-10]
MSHLHPAIIFAIALGASILLLCTGIVCFARHAITRSNDPDNYRPVSTVSNLIISPSKPKVFGGVAVRLTPPTPIKGTVKPKGKRP